MSRPRLDKRVRKAVKFYRLSNRDVSRFYAVFKRLDKSFSGEIDLADFYTLLHSKRSIIGDSILELVDAHGSRLNFKEFLYAVLTYCFFEREEILRFMFYIFDRDKNGYVEQDELQMIIKVIHGFDPDITFSGNFKATMRLLEPNFDVDGKVDFEEFKLMHELFPALLHPAFQLQVELIRRTLGERWWSAKKHQLQDRRDRARQIQRRLEKKERMRLVKMQSRRVRKKMGFFKYHCCIGQREQYRKLFPLNLPEEREAQQRRVEEEQQEKTKKRMTKIKKEAEMKLKNPETAEYKEYLENKRNKTSRVHPNTTQPHGGAPKDMPASRGVARVPHAKKNGHGQPSQDAIERGHRSKKPRSSKEERAQRRRARKGKRAVSQQSKGQSSGAVQGETGMSRNRHPRKLPPIAGRAGTSAHRR